MTLSPQHEALKLEAQTVKCIDWAIRKRWKLNPGIDRAGPCPLCGGTDRFAIHTTKNSFLCRGCKPDGGGGVIDLVMWSEGLKFIPACELITGRRADAPIDQARIARLEKQAKIDAEQQAKKQASYREQARKQGGRIWHMGLALRDRPDDDPVIAYLLARGISLQTIKALSSYLRSVGTLAYNKKIDKQVRLIHEGPAMVAAILRPDGSFGAAHQTFVTRLGGKWTKQPIFHPDTGVKLPSKLVRGTKKGGAIRLYTPKNPTKMIMGEGIETTLTVMSHAFEPDVAYWAGVDLGNMAGRAKRDAKGKLVPDQPDLDDKDSFVPPPWCQELTYLGEDQDPDNPRKAKQNRDALTRGLRRAQSLRSGLVGRISWPDGSGDFNDMVGV